MLCATEGSATVTSVPSSCRSAAAAVQTARRLQAVRDTRSCEPWLRTARLSASVRVSECQLDAGDQQRACAPNGEPVTVPGSTGGQDGREGTPQGMAHEEHAIALPATGHAAT